MARATTALDPIPTADSERVRPECPELLLAAAVLEQGVYEAGHWSKEIREDVRRWMMKVQPGYVYDFTALCVLFELSPEAVRRIIWQRMAWAAVHAVPIRQPGPRDHQRIRALRTR